MMSPRPSRSVALSLAAAADVFVSQLYTSLGAEHDKIRKRYWDYRSREAQKLVPAAAA